MGALHAGLAVAIGTPIGLLLFTAFARAGQRFDQAEAVMVAPVGQLAVLAVSLPLVVGLVLWLAVPAGEPERSRRIA